MPMQDIQQKVALAVVAAVVGTVTGWAANAVALGPRVQAIEAGQARLETLLHRLIETKERANAAK